MRYLQLTGDDNALQEKHKGVKDLLLASYDELTAGFDSEKVKLIKEALDTSLQTKYKNLQFDNRLIADAKVIFISSFFCSIKWDCFT